ncbi:hypothetical protein IGI04_018995 [Brassica rapa subsp. trilocularis]|uniref:Replication protein A 70 kDa DNA-binding subunit B/D first OB fold domain-containing protein n=1 Tax=Brassica rapa subsp. trilocularis TaxID=1813537 RepID=A0ABQ7MGZ1_BRACM|nr:hypothetical protein IGI04_018995 [Brassica rapa subsp. trilocularis]
MCSSLLMANSCAFSDLKSGQCSSVVEARLLRFWEARNVKCGGEIKWMDLLMVDVKATMMQVTISSSRLPQYRERLIVGTMFFVSGFDVSRCAQSFRLTESSLLIRFNENTTFEEITDHVSPLREEAFRFRNQSEMIGLAKTNTQFPGEILGVKIVSRHTAIELLTFLTLTENMTLSSVLQFTFRRPTTLSANKVNQLPV